MKPFIKLKKYGQAHAGRGWNQHVDKWTRRYANRVIRRELQKDMQSNEQNDTKRTS